MEGDGGGREGEGRLRFFLTVRRRGFDFRAFILLASFVTTELLVAGRGFIPAAARIWSLPASLGKRSNSFPMPSLPSSSSFCPSPWLNRIYYENRDQFRKKKEEGGGGDVDEEHTLVQFVGLVS